MIVDEKAEDKIYPVQYLPTILSFATTDTMFLERGNVSYYIFKTLLSERKEKMKFTIF